MRGKGALVGVVDDLQWADEATVLLLRDLAERLGSSHMVLIGTYWDSELDTARPFSSVLSRLLRRRRAQRFTLGPLSDRDVERIVAGLAEALLTPVQLPGIQASTACIRLFVEHPPRNIPECEI